jgi:hypothetical protein
VQQRLSDLKRFYVALARISDRVGGLRRLNACHGRMVWPAQGVYFFFEDGELRSDSGRGLRVVRVGTHGLKEGSATTLWRRLAQHGGVRRSGGGNHRGSVFRLHLGTALAGRDKWLACPTWASARTAPAVTRLSERKLEMTVTNVVGRMSLAWLSVSDESGPRSERGYVERNAIALLSNLDKTPLDSPSSDWLGNLVRRPRNPCLRAVEYQPCRLVV